MCYKWSKSKIVSAYKKEFGNSHVSLEKYLAFRLTASHLPSASQIYRYFGGYVPFMDYMAIKPRKPIKQHFELGKKDCFDSYKKALRSYKNKNKLSQIEYYRAGLLEKLVSKTTIKKLFKSWNRFQIEFSRLKNC